MIGRTLARAAEALDLILRHAADGASRRALLHVYASLSHPERYGEVVAVTFRVGELAFPFHMRIGDIFVVGELLHEKQYRLPWPVARDATIVDLGGNVGASMMWFLGHSPEADYHVFEPARDNCELLARNAAPFPNVRLERAAVGREAGTLDLHLGAFGATHSLVREAAGGSGATERVPVVPLEAYMAERGLDRIDLLKVDVEGAELDALLGLGPRIADVGCIVGEVHERVVDVEAFYDHLRRSGFSEVTRRAFRGGAEDGVHGFLARRG